MLNVLLKSIVDQDRAAIVVCDMDSTIVYMNPAAVMRYHRDLTGQSLKDCHNAAYTLTARTTSCGTGL